MELARYCGGAHAARQFAATGWTWGDGPGAIVAFDGSAVLAGLDDTALRPLLGRPTPEALAHAYLHRPALRHDIAPHWRAWMVNWLPVVRRARVRQRL